MKLYHVATEKKAELYRQNQYIKKPVRGFNTFMGAMAWAIKTGRKVIYEINSDKIYKLPDHHNKYGEAYWADENIYEFSCVLSPKRI